MSSASHDAGAALKQEPGKSDAHALARNMGLFSLVVYGVGDMVGSGIYGTVGKAAGQLGNAVWLAFVVSMVAAMLTGLSYASIASRYPRAGGAAYVTHRAFALPFLSYLVGLTVTASGLTSMATSTNVFSGILAEMVGLAKQLGRLHWSVGGATIVDADVGTFVIVLAFLAFLTFVNFWGIRESMWTNLLCTAIEVGGLLFIVFVGLRYWGGVNYLETPRATLTSTGLAPGMLLSGAVLTFFAFVGFEDMLNVAEEVKDPQRTMPRGMLMALGVVALIYIAISITAVSVVHYKDLAAAPAPLAAITAKAAPWLPGWVYKAITMFAVANTVLINYIMGSRCLYGMAKQGLVPAALARVHHARRTPHVAILVLLVLVTCLTVLGGVADLGTATGLLLLACFVVVNGALIALKLRRGEPGGRFEVPIFVPVLGIVINGALIVARLMDPALGWRAPIIAGAVVAGIGLLYFVVRPRRIDERVLGAAEEGE
jgi:basic amino acid/polyamine antiporter, APA family